MGDDEHDCTNKCTSTSKCIADDAVTCIQHSPVDQLCRCVKQGYQVITNSLQNNTPLCQGYLLISFFFHRMNNCLLN
jgi:hypothetical protein